VGKSGGISPVKKKKNIDYNDVLKSDKRKLNPFLLILRMLWRHLPKHDGARDKKFLVNN
jgi:hypothetical protein